jgi:cytochrome oxidase Cu insertion factor (SCO1/SenC/PrrC family)
MMSPVMRCLAAVVAWLVLAGVPARAADTPALWDAAEVSRPVRPVDAPRFTLPDLDGRPTRLESFHGRVVLLYFWTTW